MSPKFQIPDGTLDEWLGGLKPYQRSAINDLLRSMEPEDAARAWVSHDGGGQMAKFGGQQQTGPFWERFSNEFWRFVCDENAYVKERAELLSHSAPTKAVFISIISAGLGAKIGLTATLLAPAVAVLLYLVLKIGRNAYCDLKRPV